MASELARMLAETLERELPALRKRTEEQAMTPRGPGKWSAKEELGHLIDSAANNHGRFVRAALDGHYEGPGYAQDGWVRLHGYREMPWSAIVDLWYQYNQFVAHLVSRIPDDQRQALCAVGENAPVTLEFLIKDYVLHMQHHLDQLLQRAVITAYPGATPQKA
jgi:hypothetical protein